MRTDPSRNQVHTQDLKIKAMIDACVGDLIISVEHVGSTAVEGLAAKLIIDIDVVIDSYDVFPAVKDRLLKIGFEHEGNFGVEDREAFKRTFIDDFHDYLRNHPETVKA